MLWLSLSSSVSLIDIILLAAKEFIFPRELLSNLQLNLFLKEAFLLVLENIVHKLISLEVLYFCEWNLWLVVCLDGSY